MGDLSEHFSRYEFRCRCGCGGDVVDPGLIVLLELARGVLGRPLVINSGFRCAAYNAAVGGEADSAHLTGEAADVSCLSSSARFSLVKALLDLGALRVGPGRGFVHVDVSRTLPQEVLFLYDGEAAKELRD